MNSIRFLSLGASVSVLLVAVVLLGASAASAHPVGAIPSPSAALPLAAISIKTVNVGHAPETEIYDPATKEVYIGNTGSNSVSAINSTTYAVKTIPVGKSPVTLTYSASTKDIYVENDASNNISVIGTSNKVVHTVALPGLEPGYQAYDPANGDVYVLTITMTGSEITDIHHSNYALTTISLPLEGIVVAYDNATASMVVSSDISNELTAINATDKTTTIKLTAGTFPAFMVYDPNNKDLYVDDIGETSHGYTKTGNISVLSSANKIIKTIKVGSVPTIPSYDPSNHEIYVVNEGNRSGGANPVSTASVIGTNNSVVKVVALGKDAVIAVYDPKNSEMYISAQDSNRTYAISSSTNAIVATIKTIQYADGCVYDPALGDMMAGGDTIFTNSSSTAKTIVTVIPSTNTGTSLLTLGVGPVSGAIYDPTDSGLWADNDGANTVSIIL
jgi:YVTN family beta-propeller protein